MKSRGSLFAIYYGIHIKNYYNRGSGKIMGVEVEMEIFVDKEEVEANEFVQNVMGRAIAGAVSALKGVKDDWSEMEIKVRRK